MPPRSLPSAKPTPAVPSASAASTASRTQAPTRHPASSSSATRTDGRVVRRGGAPVPPSSSQSATALTQRPAYGDLVESDEVHDEIRALGTEVKTMLAQNFSRHGTTEEQVAWGVRQFGPSKESRAVLNKENEAAKLAWETGVYCVWRCTEAPKLRGATSDFCCRLGYRHVCFCGHPMAAHTTPPTNASTSARGGRAAATERQLAQWKSPCEEAGCTCAAFRYVPNTPLEIGEGWLTRRANFKLSEWSAKCRCGHGHKAHDPSSYLRCRSCGGCSGFTSAFLCVVCDLPWEAHATVWESEGARQAAGQPVREDYAPLKGLEWDLRELVLKDASMGGRIEPPVTYLALQAQRRASSRSPTRERVGSLPALPGASAHGRAEREARRGAGGVAADAVVEVDYCPGCATIYRSATSNFCSKCGQPRPRSRPALR